MSGQLKEVRERIKSVKNTQQITSAMKMVSRSKNNGILERWNSGLILGMVSFTTFKSRRILSL